ncbi:MAG TPA: hypothetical protein VJH90_00555 [archaeon]|nr:hypothetical protein [archaeon]
MMNMPENNGHLKLTERQLASRIPTGALDRDFGKYGSELSDIYVYVALATSVREEGDRLKEQGRESDAAMKHSKADEYIEEANMIARPIGIEIV